MRSAPARGTLARIALVRGILVHSALARNTLARIISFWLQLTRERPYRQATCHHSGTTSFVTRKGIHVES